MGNSEVANNTSRFEPLRKQALSSGPLRVGVVYPCDEYAMISAIEAASEGLIIPVFVAPIAKLHRIAVQVNVDLANYQLVDVRHSHAAAQDATKWAIERRVQALMKGSLHTDELMSATLNRDSGLRTGRLASHVFMVDGPTYNKLLFIRNGAINLAPDLDAKANISRNAIDVAYWFGIDQTRVAFLSAIETVNPRITSTTDAAALCKMVERGQVNGAAADGPLAFDNVISADAARIRGIVLTVSGRADILICPDREAGNLMVKQLVYLAAAKTAGIVVGLRVPTILYTCADPVSARLASCADATVYPKYLNHRL